jgi:hypothetical protein
MNKIHTQRKVNYDRNNNMNLVTRFKYLFGWKGGKKPLLSNLPDSKVDAHMEQIINNIEKVPYVGPPITGSDGRYNLRLSVEDGDIPEFNMVKDAASRKANAHDIVHVVLKEISKMSKFSQEVSINFKMKSGWEGYIRVFLYPEFCYEKPTGHKTDFSEIYLVENDPSFSNWERVYYRDTYGDGYDPSYDIYLNTRDMWDRYCSHYTGIWSVSWVEFLNKQRTL